MMKNTKILITLLTFMILSFGAGPAHAWYMELTDVVGSIEIGTYYTQTINFHSDAGTNNLNDYFLSVDYDETKVSLYGVAYVDYGNGDPMFPEMVWDGGIFPYADEDDVGNFVVYNLNGTETFAYMDTFFPLAGDTLMATIYWTPLVTEDDVTVSLWTNHTRADDFITVDNLQHWDPEDSNPYAIVDNYEYRDFVANTDNLAPVPIPGAVWLLGSGLLGLIGIRRKKA